MNRLDLAALAAGAAAAALVLFATSEHGPAMFQLGMHNMTAAECLVRGEVMRTTRGEVFAQWPPLLPALLALGRLLGLGYERTAMLLNAGSWFAVVSLSGLLARRLAPARWIVVATLVTVALQPTLFLLMTVLSSEPLFLALLLGTLLAAYEHAQRPARASFALVVALSALACLQRYVGVTLVGAVALLGLCYWPRAGRWPKLAIYVALSALPLAAWLARNLARVGSLTGERPPSDLVLGDNLRDGAQVMTFGWVGNGGEPRLTYLAAALFLGSSLFALLHALAVRSARHSVAWTAAFPAVYALFLVAVASLIWLDPLDERLLSPLLLFGCSLAPLGAHAAIEVARERSSGLARVLAVLLALAATTAVGYAAQRTLQIARGAREQGPGGFATAEVRSSELIAWLRAHPLEGRVLSNAPEYVAYAQRRPAELAPGRRIAEHLGSLPDFDAPLTLVWVAPKGNTALRNLDSVPQLTVEPLAELADGAIYRVSRRSH